MTANAQGNSSSRRLKSPTRRFVASAGGLTTPVNWNSTGLSVNIDDLNINDVDMSYDSNSDVLNNLNNTPVTNYEMLPYGSTRDTQNSYNNNDHDIKPVDLSLYKEKLLKKMSMGLNNTSNSPATLTHAQSLPLLPGSKNDTTKSRLSSTQAVLKVK